jgi:hypothetical protein
MTLVLLILLASGLLAALTPALRARPAQPAKANARPVSSFPCKGEEQQARNGRDDRTGGGPFSSAFAHACGAPIFEHSAIDARTLSCIARRASQTRTVDPKAVVRAA